MTDFGWRHPVTQHLVAPLIPETSRKGRNPVTIVPDTKTTTEGAERHDEWCKLPLTLYRVELRQADGLFSAARALASQRVQDLAGLAYLLSALEPERAQVHAARILRTAKAWWDVAGTGASNEKRRKLWRAANGAAQEAAHENMAELIKLVQASAVAAGR